MPEFPFKTHRIFGQKLNREMDVAENDIDCPSWIKFESCATLPPTTAILVKFAPNLLDRRTIMTHSLDRSSETISCRILLHKSILQLLLPSVTIWNPAYVVLYEHMSTTADGSLLLLHRMSQSQSRSPSDLRLSVKRASNSYDSPTTTQHGTTELNCRYYSAPGYDRAIRRQPLCDQTNDTRCGNHIHC